MSLRRSYRMPCSFMLGYISHYEECMQEQYDLLPRRLARSPPDVSVYNKCVYYQHTEFNSKNNQHKFKDRESGKVSRAYAQVDQECCIVKILDKYLAKLSPDSPGFYNTCAPSINIRFLNQGHGTLRS